jgi:hypothetical protein
MHFYHPDLLQEKTQDSVESKILCRISPSYVLPVSKVQVPLSGFQHLFKLLGSDIPSLCA